MRGWIHTRLPRDWRWRTPPPALSLAIRCVREIWTGKWGIRNQSCAWNVDYPQANRRTQIFSLVDQAFMALPEFQEFLSLQICCLYFRTEISFVEPVLSLAEVNRLEHDTDDHLYASLE